MKDNGREESDEERSLVKITFFFTVTGTEQSADRDTLLGGREMLLKSTVYAPLIDGSTQSGIPTVALMRKGRNSTRYNVQWQHSS